MIFGVGVHIVSKPNGALVIVDGTGTPRAEIGAWPDGEPRISLLADYPPDYATGDGVIKLALVDVATLKNCAAYLKRAGESKESLQGAQLTMERLISDI